MAPDWILFFVVIGSVVFFILLCGTGAAISAMEK
jgi:hypothetical protein